MTKDEFEAFYARNSKIPLARLKQSMGAYLCDCGDDLCEGWQMLTYEGAEAVRSLGILDEDED